MADTGQQTDPWAVSSETPVAGSQPAATGGAPSDPWAVASEAPAGQQPTATTPPAPRPGLSASGSAPLTPPPSPWAQAHPFLSKILADPTSPTYQETQRHIAQQQGIDAGDDLDAASTLPKAALQLAKGTKQVFTPTEAESRQEGMLGIEHGIGLPGAPMTPAEKAAAIHQQAAGTANMIAGGGTIALAVDSGNLGGILGEASGIIPAASPAAKAAAQVAVAKFLAYATAGEAGSKLTGIASDKMGLAPETKELAQTFAQFFPVLLGAAAAKAGVANFASDASGNIGASVKTPGGAAGVSAGPDGMMVGARVGSRFVGNDAFLDRAIGPKYSAPPAPPTPGQIAQGEATQAAHQAVSEADAVSKAAENIVNPPPPPPAPPPPPGMEKGVLTPKVVSDAAAIIRSTPPEMQSQAIMEAHGKLAEWMLKQGKFIGPDGKLQIADSPAKAASLAQQVLNDEVDRHTKAAADAQQQQEQQQADLQKQRDAQSKAADKAQAEAQKAAETPNENGLTPAEVQQARAKTIIESSTSPQQASANLMRSLRIPREQAQVLIAQHQQAMADAATPDVGSAAEPTKEESRATVDAQMAALQKGDINVVMLPEGSRYRPAVPEGYKVMAVHGDAPGAGLYVYNPSVVGAATIRAAAKSGTHGDLLGHIQSKEELADGKPTVVVQAHTPEGTPIQDSQVHADPGLIQTQEEALRERHPDAQISVKTPEQVLAERQDAAQWEPVSEKAHDVTTETNLAEEGGRGQSPEPMAGGDVSSPPAQPTEDAPAAPEPPPASDASRETPATSRGSRVAFTDRNGVEREGTVAFKAERTARIKDDRGKTYDNVPLSGIGEARPLLQPGGIGRVATTELHLDPKRFQYKVSGIGESGTTSLLSDAKWNDDLAGIVSAWRDPADNKIYAVNGHHRTEKAKAAGVPNLAVRLLKADNATQARTVGALQNIAEGRGTAIDAAKFLRDSGMTLDDLKQQGISMGEATAQNGVALSRLDGRLFDQVVHGKMTPGRGIAIGRETGDPATQDAILKMIEKAEKAGRRVTDGVVEELARFAHTAPQRQETVASLFGSEERTESTALDKAAVSAYVKRQMATEKRVFGAVATDRTAARLTADGKNQIDAKGNAERASSAEQALEVYDKLSARRGPIDDILNSAAAERASAKPSQQADIDGRAYEAIRTAVSETLGRGQESVPERVPADPSSGEGDEPARLSKAELEDAGQIGFFSRRRPLTNDDVVDAAADKLLGIHNTSAEGILAADRLGGIPAPSIAILRQHGSMAGFGDISLVSNRQMLDPETNPHSRLFDADVYSPRQPRPSRKLIDREADKFEAGIRKVIPENARQALRVGRDAFNSYMPDRSERLTEDYARSVGVQYAYLKSIGKAPELAEAPVKIREPWLDTAATQNWLANHPGMKPYPDMGSADHAEISKVAHQAFRENYEAALGPEGTEELWRDQMATEENPALLSFRQLDRIAYDLKTLQKNERTIDKHDAEDAVRNAVRENGGNKPVEAFVKAGLEKAFGPEYLQSGRAKKDYTLENVLQAMVGKGLRGAEDTMTHGLGQARAAAAKQFPSIQALRADSKRIVDPKEAEKAHTEIQDQFFAWQGQLTHQYGQWESLDAASKSLGDYLKGPKTESGMRSALSRNDFETKLLSPETMQQGMKLAKTLAEAPAEYFEAKLRNAVGLSEFSAAVVPEGTPQPVLDVLAKHGVRVDKYQGEDGRREVLNEVVHQEPGALFARRRPQVESMALPGMEDDVDAQAAAAKNLSEEQQRDLVNQALRTPDDISKAAGEMERNSPLFFGSGAGGNQLLFARGSGVPTNRLPIQVVPAEGNDSAQIHLNPAASRLLSALSETVRKFPEWNGVALNPSAVQLIGHELQTAAKTADAGVKQVAEVFLDALHAATDAKGNVILINYGAGDAAIAEEQHHAWQMREGVVLSGEVTQAVKQAAGFASAAAELRKSGYKFRNDGFAVMEVTAHIASGDGLGLPAEQQAELLTRYFEAVKAQSGQEALDRIPAMAADWMYPEKAENDNERNGDSAGRQNGGPPEAASSQAGSEASSPGNEQTGTGLPAESTAGAGAGGTELSPSGDTRAIASDAGVNDQVDRARSLVSSLEDQVGEVGRQIRQGYAARLKTAKVKAAIIEAQANQTKLLEQLEVARKELAQLERRNKPAEPEPTGPQQMSLFSRAIPGIKPLAQIKPAADAIAFLRDEAERVAISRDLHNGLYDLASQDNADVLRVVQMLKAMPGTAKDQEAIYHHLEDPKGNALTPEQEAILDDHLTPLIYQAQHDFQVVTEGGVPIENYVHRQVREKGGAIERLLEKAKEKAPASVGGGRLSTAAPAKKHRTMMSLERVADTAYGKRGDRQVVAIKGGRVTAYRKGEAYDMGALRSGFDKAGDIIDERMAPYVKRVSDLRDEIAGAKDADRDEQLGDVQGRIAELQKQRETLDAVKVRTGTTPRKDELFDKGGKPTYSTEATFAQRARISRELEPLLKKEEALKAGKAPMLVKNEQKLVRRKAALDDAEAERDRILDQVPTDELADTVWKDSAGDLHRITQATTKEIEADTDLRYYHNAAGSVAVNYLAMSKARRAYEFMEALKASPEFAGFSHSMKSPGAIPKGWRTTQLPQFRGYFFEPHVSEVLDEYAKKAAHEPGVLDKVNNFLRTSIFFNPLIHIPNLANHWVVEKGVTGLANPFNYPKITAAGIRAINAVVHQNQDFLDALDAGGPLQSQQFETKQLADLFFKKMQDELGPDPESSKWKEMASALGMAPVRLVKAVYELSGKATWYFNDIAFLQSTYEKQARGMGLKESLQETSKHIPDYRYMTRIFDNRKLGQLMSNSNITMFGAYHYGALKSYGQMAKSLGGFNWQDAGTKNEKGEPTNGAGRTAAEERLHGLDGLAMIGLVTFVVYPIISHLLKAITGDQRAEMRRAGASTLPYNLYLLARGERTPGEIAQSIATPSVGLQTAAELAFNRDLRTGQRIYNPHAPAGQLGGQIGRRLLESVAPVNQGLQMAEGRLDAKKLAYSMVGVSFPLHGAMKIASQINAEKMASLPPKDEAQIAHSVQRSRALHDAWAGNRAALDKVLASPDFTPKEKAKIRKDALLPPVVYAIRSMDYDDALRVYKAGTAQEKAQMRPILNRKLQRLVKDGKKPSEGSAILNDQER